MAGADRTMVVDVDSHVEEPTAAWGQALTSRHFGSRPAPPWSLGRSTPGGRNVELLRSQSLTPQEN